MPKENIPDSRVKGQSSQGQHHSTVSKINAHFYLKVKNKPSTKLQSRTKYRFCVSKLKNALNGITFSNEILFFETVAHVFHPRIESHHYPPDEIPFPTLVMCADVDFDEFHAAAMKLDMVDHGILNNKLLSFPWVDP